MKPIFSALTLAMVLWNGAASAAVVTVTDAKVQGGKLLVTGTTPSANQNVTLDARFTVKSGPARVFSFSINNYLPSDCVVDLKAGAALGTGVVANCGRGLSPRGGWGSAASYQVDDLVVFLGSSWRAKIASKGQRPDTHPALWEKFAYKGDVGAAGPAGAAGPQGPQGPQGPAGPSTGPAGGDLAGSYPNPAIANGSVTSAKIKDGDVSAADLAPDSVTSAQIATDAVGATEIADNSIDSGEIVDNSLFANDLGAASVGNSELQDGAVTNSKIASNAIDSGKVASNTLTAFDIAGGESNGAISLGAGYVANGRCRDGSIGVGSAKAGDAVAFSINGVVPEGILIAGVRAPSDGIVTIKVCNFTGGVMAAISNLPIAVVTITI